MRCSVPKRGGLINESAEQIGASKRVIPSLRATFPWPPDFEKSKALRRLRGPSHAFGMTSMLAATLEKEVCADGPLSAISVLIAEFLILFCLGSPPDP